AEPQAGLYSLIQPTIEPLFGGRSFEDALIHLAWQFPAGKAKFLAPPPPPAPPPAPAVPTAAGAAAAAPAVPTPAGAAPAAPAAAPAATAAAKPGAAAAGAATAAVPAPKPAAPPAVAISFHDYLQRHWREQIYPKNNLAASFDDFWVGVLQAGVFDPNPQRLQPGAARAFKPAALAAVSAPAAPTPASGELELSLAVSAMLGDGSWGNNAFLQEIPDPCWKSCWDNFFTIAPSTAKSLGLEADNDGRYGIGEVTVGSTTLRAPVYVQVGVHPAVASMYVGYGRASVGEVGTDVGVNAYRLGQVSGAAIVASGARVKINKVGQGYLIASPQENNYFDFGANEITGEQGRGENIVRETTLVQIQANPRAGNPEPEPQTSLWDNGGPSEHPFPNYHWGMTVDLNACIGCNACVAACYAENNVPVVGKDQVW